MGGAAAETMAVVAISTGCSATGATLLDVTATTG
jgi:hypothetical protein